MLAGGDDDAEPGAGVDIDMGKDAALADQLQFRQPFQQRRSDLRPLPDQHQRFGSVQALGKLVDILDVIVPDRHITPGKLAVTIQRPQRVKIIVEDRDLHDTLPLGRVAATSPPAIRRRTSAWRWAE
jgi:hypothetical protein